MSPEFFGMCLFTTQTKFFVQLSIRLSLCATKLPPLLCFVNYVVKFKGGLVDFHLKNLNQNL